MSTLNLNLQLSLLIKAIQQIYNKNQSNLSFEEVYRASYNLVLKRRGDDLYEQVEQEITRELEKLKISYQDKNNIQLLNTFLLCYEHHTTCLLMLRDVLMYMDRIYVPLKNLKTCYELGIYLFKTVNLNLFDLLISCLIDQINNYRTDELKTAKTTIKKLILMLINLGLIDQFFNKFKQSTTIYYKNISYKLETISEYLIFSKYQLEEEESRIDEYLYQQCKQEILLIIHDELLGSKIEMLINHETGLFNLISLNKYDDLQLMYDLLSNGHLQIRNMLKTIIIDYGTKINNSCCDKTCFSVESESNSTSVNNPLKWMQDILELKIKFDLILVKSFKKDKNFQSDVSQAFEHVVNINLRSPEFVCLYIDNLLKKGLKGVTLFDILENRSGNKFRIGELYQCI